MKNELIIDPSLLDFDNPIADIEAIRELNPQRHEMEQLTAILYEDLDRHAGLLLVPIEHFVGAVAGTAADGPVTVRDVASVETSFPGFDACLREIGADIICQQEVQT